MVSNMHFQCPGVDTSKKCSAIVIYIQQGPPCSNRYKYLEMNILENGGAKTFVRTSLIPFKNSQTGTFTNSVGSGENAASHQGLRYLPC